MAAVFKFDLAITDEGMLTRAAVEHFSVTRLGQHLTSIAYLRHRVGLQGKAMAPTLSARVAYQMRTASVFLLRTVCLLRVQFLPQGQHPEHLALTPPLICTRSR